MKLLSLAMSSEAVFGYSLAALAAGLLALIIVHRNRSQTNCLQTQFQAELAAAAERCDTASLVRLDEISCQLATLEARIPEVGAVRGGIGRTDRSRAMQLLRSGLEPATVASTLNLQLREIQLLGAVSQVLLQNAGERDANAVAAVSR